MPGDGRRYPEGAGQASAGLDLFFPANNGHRPPADPGLTGRPPEGPEALAAEPPSGGNGRRALWTFADQALSSLTNAGLTIVVARSFGEDAFGAFSLALLTFGFMIGFGRATVGDPYVIRFSDADPAERHRATRQAAGAAIALGLFAATLCAIAAVLVPDDRARGGLLALAISLPGLLLQDTWRFAFFAAGRPAAATLSDGVWAVLQFSILGMLLSQGVDSVFWITLAWGMSALVAAVLGIFQTKVLPSVASARHWFQTHKDLNIPMGIDFALNMGAVNLATYVVTAIIGLVAAGALRAVQTLTGPLNLFRSGLDAFVLPMMARRAGTGRSLLGLVAATSGAATAVTGVWVGCLLLLSDSAGKEVLGASWDEAREVLVGFSIVVIAQAGVLGASLGIKALRRADLLLRVTTIQAPLILSFGCIGAWQWGIQGAAFGFGLAQALGTAISWYYFQVANKAERDWVDAEAV
jgi:O-antigen/teichoic acid export membrane protein